MLETETFFYIKLFFFLLLLLFRILPKNKKKKKTLYENHTKHNFHAYNARHKYEKGWRYAR